MACKEMRRPGCLSCCFFALCQSIHPFPPSVVNPGITFMKIPKLSLTQWIFVGMGIGLVLGWFVPEFAVSLRPLSTIFLRLIKSIIAPLIFATLVVGIAGHGNLKQVGRMGVKALIYFEVVTTLAMVVGLVAVNLMRPGVGVNLHTADANG